MISRKREISLECVFKSPLGHIYIALTGVFESLFVRAPARCQVTGMGVQVPSGLLP